MFSGLSFLGLGVQPPVPEWGAMVSDGVLNFNYWWISTFPGLAIFSVAIGANFVGDSIRDYFDPKMRRENWRETRKRKKDKKNEEDYV